MGACAYTQCLGFLSKSAALRCDTWRAAHSRHNALFSLEWLSEWYWALTYWTLYRYLVVFCAPSKRAFVVTLCAHSVWEFCAVFGRLQRRYFEASNFCTDRLPHLKCLMYAKDHCTFNVWRHRLEMDVAVKVAACLCSALFFVVMILLDLPLYVDVRPQESGSLQTMLSFFGVSVLTEVSLYALMVVGQEMLFDHTMFQHFVAYIRELSNLHIFFLLLFCASVLVPVC